MNSASLSSSPYRTQMNWGDNAMSAPTTPEHRVEHFDRSQVPPEVRQAAEGMESMFLDYLMKTMRQTVPKNDMDLSSPATEIYQGMLDSETAQTASRAGGVGLADQIIAYMMTDRYTQSTGHGAPPSVQGGTHASQLNRK